MAQSEWLRHLGVCRKGAIHMETAALSEAMRQQAHPFQTHALHANSGAQDLAPTNAEALRAWHAFSKLSAANPAFATLQRYAATHARAYARAERELRDYRIAKAESIHPTPEPCGPANNLELTPSENIPSENFPEDRWQPLEVAEPAPESKEEATEKTTENTPENITDETKVTLTPSPFIPSSPASSIDPPPQTELNSKVGSSLVSSPDPIGQSWATTVEEAACTLGQPTPYPSR
jgi:hypothetical protein